MLKKIFPHAITAVASVLLAVLLSRATAPVPAPIRYGAATQAVPLTRTITTSTGLTGGGTLAANRTLAVDSTAVPVVGASNLGADINLGGHGAVNTTGMTGLAAGSLLIGETAAGGAGPDWEVFTANVRTTGKLFTISNFTTPVASFDSGGDVVINGPLGGGTASIQLNGSGGGSISTATAGQAMVVAGDLAAGSTAADVVIGGHFGTIRTAGDTCDFVDSTFTKTAYVKFDGKFGVISGNTQSTIGANGAASALTANPVGFIKFDVNGSTRIVPYYNP